MPSPFDQDQYPSSPPYGPPTAPPAHAGPFVGTGGGEAGAGWPTEPTPVSTPAAGSSYPPPAAPSYRPPTQPPLPPPVPPPPGAAGPGPAPGPAPAGGPRRWTSSGSRIGLAVAIVVAVLFGAAGGGLASRAVFSSSVEATAPSAASGSSGSASSPSTLQPPTTATPGTGSNGSGSSGSSGSGTPNGTTISSWDDVVATVSVGVVNIESLMPRGVGAGTGMALTADGEILTNNHVVQDARQIVVTVATTGQSYSASIVGTDPQEDVAVLQLQDASGLATIPLGDSDQVQVRDQVAAIGNAGGRGGTPSVATGQVVALGQQITASDEDGSNAETLQDMIRVDANVVPGDSGGPLANTDGQVIGMNTAAAVANAGGGARFGGFNGSNEGYAIPINKALQLAQELQSGAGSSGSSSSGSTSGSTPFLGVQVTTGLSGGAEVAGVQTGSPAADAGLTAGDVIVRIDRTGIETAADVVTAISDHSPGDEISITYLDSSGSSHQTTATLAGR